MAQSFLRRPQVAAIFPVSKAGLYQRIAAGTFPPPIKVGAASVWELAEVESVMAAMAAGVPADGVRGLVEELVAARKHPDTERRRAAILRRHLQGAE
jgi:predicted DNA-binding transcriptional regulator AlpA